MPDQSDRALPLLFAACLFAGSAVAHAAPAASAAASVKPEPAYSVRMLPLPRTTSTGVALDFIAFDPATHSIWVPAGNTGTIAVIDARTGKSRVIDAQPTAEVKRGERTMIVGPSSVVIGTGVVYVGNRGDSSVCVFDPTSLEKKTCRRLDSMPDCLAIVERAHELWVTTPRDKSIRVLDSTTLAEKTRLPFDGNPEGLAVDGPRGRVYTNLEDKDKTLALDLASHKTLATWSASCGEDGPHGLRVEPASGRLLVACSTRVEVLDAPRDGRMISSIDTDDGVDDIEYAPATSQLYVGAAKTGQLTIARVATDGKLTVLARVATHEGARNPVVTDDGVIYLAHSGRSTLTDLVVVESKR